MSKADRILGEGELDSDAWQDLTDAQEALNTVKNLLKKGGNIEKGFKRHLPKQADRVTKLQKALVKVDDQLLDLDSAFGAGVMNK